MSKVQAKTFRFLPFFVLIAVMLSGGRNACAAELPLDIKLSIASGKVMVGQPIIVDCELTNPSGQPGVVINSSDALQIYASDTPGCQVWFELYNAEKQLVVREVPPVLKSRSVVISSEVNKDKAYLATFIVSRAAMPKTPGRYAIRVHINLEYSNLPKESLGYEKVDSHENVFSKVVELSVVVTPADTTPLRKIASKLSTVIKEGSAASAVAIRAMVSMPETIAYPYWCELANTRQLKMSAFLVRDLQLLGSMYAARALAAMWGDEFKEDRNLEAKTALIELHQTAAPAVRRYIGNVYRDRESKELIDSEHPIIRALDAD